MSFSRQPCPVWLFDDLVGNILDDNYYMSFLENTIPYLPQPVYQDDQGSVAWANPLQFHPDGTLPDNLYFEEGAVYRLEIRRGPTQSDPLIRLVQNYVAGNSDDPTDIALPIDNQITNPQFAFISFADPYVIENTGNNSYDIAPGWVLELESSGAVTVTLSRTAITGNDNIPDGSPTNPSYALKIEVTTGTLTSSKLRQRFDHAPAIWASEGISICFTAKMLNNNAEITVSYVPSDGTSTIVVSDTISTVYQLIMGGLQLPESDSTDTGDDGYVDIVFTLPIFGTCYLTNIQAIGSPQAADYPYSQTTVERQLDQTFHVYQDSLLRQSKQNLLAGWNFGLNPWQFANPAAATIAPKTSYIADQTILYQETASSIQVAQAAYNLNYGLQLAGVNGVNANRFAIIQYIDMSTMWPYWGQVVSSLIRAVYNHSAGALAAPKLKMRLIWRTDLPPTLGNSEPITGFDASGNPTFAAGWTAIIPLNDPAYTMTNLSSLSVGNLFPSLPFDQFTLPTPVMGTVPLYLGVVVYINKPLNNTLGNVDYVVFDRISLTPNDYAVDACIETFDESLRRCQYYYEKSYNVDVLPGAATAIGQLSFNQSAATSGISTVMWPSAFSIPYKTSKRGTPTLTVYAPVSGTAANVSAKANSTDYTSGTTANYAISNYTASIGTNYASYVPAGGASVGPLCGGTTVPQVGFLNLHYTADARLGV